MIALSTLAGTYIASESHQNQGDSHLEAQTISKSNDADSIKLPYKKAYVDFEVFNEVTKQAQAHRKDRLIHFADFIAASKTEGTIILDTRSKAMYDRMHIKGAIHLNFSDFNQASLAEIIPNFETRILIYCNNNFTQEPLFVVPFVTKSIQPLTVQKPLGLDTPPKTLALNIPTYINLFGYGYKNVYELSELVSTEHPLLALEGTDVPDKFNLNLKN